MSTVNPFDVYLRQLVHQFYRTPTNGFTGRLIALLVLTGLHIILALVYIALSLVPSLKRFGGGGVWLFRQVRRGSSTYGVFKWVIVAHFCRKVRAHNSNRSARLLGPICTITWVRGTPARRCSAHGAHSHALLQGAIALAYLADSKRVFCDRGDYTTATWILRGIQWIPLFGAGWLVSSSFLQAFFLATSETEGRKLSSRVTNLSLLFSGLCLFALQLVSVAPLCNVRLGADPLLHIGPHSLGNHR